MDGGGNSGTEVPFRRSEKFRYEDQKKQLPACLGRVIRQRREALKLTRKAVATKSGLYFSIVVGVEDATGGAFLFQLRWIAEALGTTLGRLLKKAGLEAQLDRNRLKRLHAAVNANDG